MANGECKIKKLQIREVTSHYRSGVVFLVVQPNEDNYNPIIKQENFIDHKKIKPLIIENVVVKAKKTSKRRKKKKNNDTINNQIVGEDD